MKLTKINLIVTCLSVIIQTVWRGAHVSIKSSIQFLPFSIHINSFLTNAGPFLTKPGETCFELAAITFQKNCVVFFFLSAHEYLRNEYATLPSIKSKIIGSIIFIPSSQQRASTKKFNKLIRVYIAFTTRLLKYVIF